jgi:hypothetical protein
LEFGAIGYYEGNNTGKDNDSSAEKSRQDKLLYNENTQYRNLHNKQPRGADKIGALAEACSRGSIDDHEGKKCDKTNFESN